MALKNDIIILSTETGGRVSKNKNLMAHVPEGETSTRLIKAARYGTPALKIGEISPTIMITAGVHGTNFPLRLQHCGLLRSLKLKIYMEQYI